MEGWQISMTFVKGQRVHVEFDGTISRQIHEYGIEVQTADDAYMAINVAYITPLEPADWPPQLGDIWEVDGEEYYARENRAQVRRGEIVIDRFGNPADSFVQGRFDDFKSLSPTLVRRRGQ
jgi:hypothetical protein